MEVLDAAAVRAATPWPALIRAIAEVLTDSAATAPPRTVLPVPMADGTDGTQPPAPPPHPHAETPADGADGANGAPASLLLMPALRPGETIGVKVVTYFPTNAGSDVPTVNAGYLVFDGKEGRLVAVLDGDELTVRRTAAVSALAARYLARPDARRLLVVGTGQVAHAAALAHAHDRSPAADGTSGRDPAHAAVPAHDAAERGAGPADGAAEKVTRAGALTHSHDPERAGQGRGGADTFGHGAAPPQTAGPAGAERRPLEAVEVWGRNPARARAVVGRLAEAGLPASAVAVDDLAGAVRRADIVSCATGATEPLVAGGLLRPGTHLDLIGSFRPDMREVDDEAVRRASVFVDTRAGASVAGDLAQPLATGVIDESQIRADLADLVAGRHPGRTAPAEITLFKSAGFALADLAAARLVLAR